MLLAGVAVFEVEGVGVVAQAKPRSPNVLIALVEVIEVEDGSEEAAVAQGGGDGEDVVEGIAEDLALDSRGRGRGRAYEPSP